MTAGHEKMWVKVSKRVTRCCRVVVTQETRRREGGWLERCRSEKW